MNLNQDFSYCQARLQARYANLPDAAEWQRLAGVRTLAAFIEEARLGPMRPWVKRLSATSDALVLERGLRALAAELADEAARWVPRPWRAAVAWTAWLPYLPVFEHLADTTPPKRPPDWASADARLRALVTEEGEPDPDALERAGLRMLLDAPRPDQIPARWANAWRDRWPPGRRGWTRDLEAFTAGLAAHLGAFRQAAPAEAWNLRAALRERLRLQFHQHLLAPVTVYIYLALILLDLERLRAELLRRALFPPSFQEGRAS
jgi:hypothetical protein